MTSCYRNVISSAVCRLRVITAALIFGIAMSTSLQAEDASLVVKVTGVNGRPLPCRITLKDEAGKAPRQTKLPFWRDHFVCPGKAELLLPAGKYTFEIERGPEYGRVNGEITLKSSGRREVSFQLKRIANLAAKGWYAGDLHVHRPLKDIRLLMQAEDLHVAPVITWWNNRDLWKDREIPARLLEHFDENRYYHLMAGEDEREGGALMFYNLRRPLKITGSGREFPSPMKFVKAARRHKNVWIDVEKPFWWDVPVWLASGEIDSIGLANNHMCHNRMYESEAWGKPRDAKRLPPPRGNGYWTQELYYHILNCGLRIPPSAGSASGVLPNPVGYNRVYVHVGKEFNYDNWWNGLKAGRSFVTNGPLLTCRANGKLPGHVFTAGEGDNVAINVDVSLISNDPIPALEIIKDGRLVRRVNINRRLGDVALGTLTFRQSGWFLVRAIADNPRTFRFASTAPYYVEVGKKKRRISKQSTQFFLDWVEERIARVKKNLDDPRQRNEVLLFHEQGRKFWRDRLGMANVP